MDLDGTVERNLISAIRSARRLRAGEVHRDTIEHWTSVLRQAEAELLPEASAEQQALAQLVWDLRAELAARKESRTD